LIWGHIDNQPITETEAGRTVSFNLKHKFTQVRVKISVSKISGATITGIGTVTIENQNTVDLTVQDGALSNYTNVGALDVSSSLYTGDNVSYLSDYYVFHPSPTRVNISSIEITVGGIPKTYSNLFATFTQGLTEAGNYTLAVDLEKFGFAGSNIYWDGSKLTFDKVNTSSLSDYMGVYFLWGSLVGVSPVGNNGPRPNYLFIPPVNAGEVWEVKNKDDTPWSTSTYYLPLPYMSSGTTTAGNVNHLYNNPNFSAYLGDICSYLTEGTWRIPNLAEFGVKADYVGHSYLSSVMEQFYIDGTTEYGRKRVSRGVTYNVASGSVFLPTANMRMNYSNTGSLLAASRGYYWTGSPHGSGDYAWQWEFMPDATWLVNTPEFGDRKFACSVRCIKI
jgi:hypothetical protein